MVTGLPKSLMVNGREEPIRYEYTAVLDAMAAMNDPDLEPKEKVFSCLYIMYPNFEKFEHEDYEPAFKEIVSFMNNGVDEQTRSNIKLVDFEQDYRLLISAVNRVAGKEVRECEDLHWWTFLGYFMEIGECTYSTVLTIRNKRKKGKKLEKWEQEFAAENKHLIEIREKKTEAVKENEAWLNSLLD